MAPLASITATITDVMDATPTRDKTGVVVNERA
jgi:hypothetical protein